MYSALYGRSWSSTLQDDRYGSQVGDITSEYMNNRQEGTESLFLSPIGLAR